MITITVKQLVEAAQPLGRVMGEKLPFKVSWSISRTLRELDKELETYNERRGKLLNLYGVAQPDGRYNFPVDGNYQLFVNEMLDVDKESLEISTNQIYISDLEGIQAAPADLAILDWLFTEQERPK